MSSTLTARSSSLRELEPLSRTLLSVLLALFAAGVAADESFGLQLLAQLRVELHQRASNTELHGISLAVHAAAGNIGQHIERCGSFGGDQRLLRARA